MPVIAGIGFGGGFDAFRLPTFVRTSMFFDRAEVKNALDRMEYRALTRASLLVRRTAQKSINKMGMAKPLLREQKANPGMDLASIVRSPGITERRRRVVIERIREIQAKDPSDPGTPPHTHVPNGHMLGFRRNLYNAYDSGAHSAVVGPSQKGKNWTIPRLHEFGGVVQLRQWVLQPQYPRYGKPITTWINALDSLTGRWVPTNARRTVNYPPRPFMRPALDKSMPQFQRFFEGQFSAGMAGG